MRTVRGGRLKGASALCSRILPMDSEVHKIVNIVDNPSVRYGPMGGPC